MHLNQARVRLVKFATDAHKKCWEQATPTKPCWECRGEGVVVNFRNQTETCPRCRGAKGLRW